MKLFNIILTGMLFTTLPLVGQEQAPANNNNSSESKKEDVDADKEITRALEEKVEKLHQALDTEIHKMWSEVKDDKLKVTLELSERSFPGTPQTLLVENTAVLSVSGEKLSDIKLTRLESSNGARVISQRIISSKVADKALEITFIKGPDTTNLKYADLTKEAEKQKLLNIYQKDLASLLLNLERRNKIREDNQKRGLNEVLFERR